MNLPVEIDSAYRRVWNVPEPLRPSQWAERYRTLTRRQSSRPGRWSNETAPCLAGPMDLAIHPRVRKLSIMKAAQVGVSEAIRNVIGFMADREPDPVLLNLPNEAHGRGIFADRIIPLIEDTDCLSALLSDRGRDVNLSQITLLNGFVLRLGWSGSPTSQASHPIRLVWNDETDKFAPWAGNESDPISLAEVRTVTYANSCVISTSTPTTRDGLIFRLYDSAPVKLAFHAPCPHCGAFQPLIFSQLKWEKIDIEDKHQRAAAMIARGDVWYECVKCAGKILEHQRQPMLMKGCWTTEDGGYRLCVDGTEHGQLPEDSEIGAHLSALHSLAAKHHFRQIVAEWMRSEGDPMRLQNFRNSWLGEVFEIRVSGTTSGVIRAKAQAASDPLIVPSWAAALIATADTQKDCFWFTIRAWGYGYKSQLVHYGLCHTFDELYHVCLESSFPIDGQAGSTATPTALLIDTGGNRTSEVYEFALQDQRIIPCKGSSGQIKRPWTMHPQPNGLVLRMIDVDYFKDFLHRLVNDPDPVKWMPHKAVADDYCHQLVSEHKIFDRKRRRQVWIPVTSGAANHLFDCEILQCAAADMGNFGVSQTTVATRQPQSQQRRSDTVSPTAWMRRGMGKRW